MNCPYCQDQEAQIKFGKNRSGSQKYRCKKCERFYTPESEELGYSEDKRLQAVRMYVDGGNLRRVARHLGVSPQSVANWVKAYAARLPEAPQPEEVDVVEMDELHTFIEHKKTKLTS
jgi:transposase